jgi:hypothetical protein
MLKYMYKKILKKQLFLVTTSLVRKIFGKTTSLIGLASKERKLRPSLNRREAYKVHDVCR